MTEFWQFWDAHPFLAWCALWLVWGAVIVVIALVQAVVSIYQRTLRAIVLGLRGWPPDHLDADGDWPKDGA